MPRKPKLDTSIKEIMVVEDPAAIKLLFTPKYAEIIKLVSAEELSVSDVARKLNVNSGSVHYHMKELEKHGLVKLVREEITGGVVKKYYRTAAVNLTINASNPKSAPAAAEAGFGEEFMERLIRSMSYFGYDVPADKMDLAKRDLLTADMRAKAILAEVQQAGLEKDESDRMLVANAYQIAVLLRLMGDEEFLRAVRTFTTSFSRKKENKAGDKK
jgi:DNA-binding transcriptional ArsR family regulator